MKRMLLRLCYGSGQILDPVLTIFVLLRMIHYLHWPTPTQTTK